MTEKERSRAKFLARQAEQVAEREAIRQAGKRRASRAEQHGRYIDAGPLAWDDQTNPDY